MSERKVAPCRLCGETKPLVKAHIFPQALAKDVGTREDPGRAYALNGAHPRRLPTGWYDPEILCERCDGRVLGPLDNYGVEFLRAVDQYHVHPPAPNGARLASRPGADPIRLKSFLLSVLWRAAISGLPDFEGVSLGPFEPELRQRIIDGSTHSVDDFATMVTWCDDDPGELISLPHRIRFRGGVRAYILHVGRHSAVIKVDSRRAPEFIRPLLLDSDRAVTVLVDSVIEGPIGRQVRRLIEIEDRAAWSTGSRAPRRRR